MKGASAVRFALALCAGMSPGLASCQWAQPAAKLKASPAVRVIEDRPQGLQWLLLRNADHPGGPGMLVPQLWEKVDLNAPQSDERSALQTRANVMRLRPVIRAGERLTIEDDSPMAHLRIEAVAMMPASAEEVFKVSLSVGGATVKAIALGPGRAKLAPSFERLP